MRGKGRRTGVKLLLAAGVFAFAAPAGAQKISGINPGRDCQTVRTCNFSRHGEVRGCLSSYSCRACKLVRQRCEVAGRTLCQRFVCSWGG